MNGRSREFTGDPHRRFWWHNGPGRDYVPPIYSFLTDEEWGVVARWYEQTERDDHIGEIAVPAMSLVQGLVMGNALTRIVQLGHYAGYSTLLLGFMLRRLGATPGLVSIDIHERFTGYTRGWVDEAGLSDNVRLVLGDSADPALVPLARDVLAGPPQLVLIDSAHTYEHTLRELDLWFDALMPGGLVAVHDSSTHSQQFDRTGAGGVRRALREWLGKRPDARAISFGDDGVWADPCGLCLVRRDAPT